MRIDVHAHHLPKTYLDVLAEGAGPKSAPHDEATLQKMVEGQEAGGVDVQVLSTGPHSPYLRDPGFADRGARTINDALADVVDRWGGRFAAYASLPLPHAEAATREAIRCLDELGFAGVHMGCSALGKAPDDPSFEELWSELDRREAVVYVHPGGVVAGTEPGLAGMEDPAIAVTIGSAAEIATAALRLAGLSRRHRKVRFIIGLLGGSLPFLMQRVVLASGMSKFGGVLPLPGESPSLVEQLRGFHYDINLLPDPAVLGSARQAYGVDRFVFGSDAPTGAPATASAFLRAGGLSEDECEAVLATNGATVFAGKIAGEPARAVH